MEHACVCVCGTMDAWSEHRGGLSEHGRHVTQGRVGQAPTYRTS